MSIKRMSLVIVVASVVALTVGIGPQIADTARALPPVQEASPSGVTIPYPGRLAGDDGQMVADGAYDFTFALYAAETGSEPLWSEVQEGVLVKDGLFAVSLGSVNPIPHEALAPGALWLAVGVCGPGEAGFTALVPRQSLSVAAPVAPGSPAQGAACPHDHYGEAWAGDDTIAGLNIVNSYTDGTAIVGITPNGGNAIGVYGNVGGGGDGVLGFSGSGTGVHGTSTSGDGVAGETAGAGMSGVYGNNTGSGYGVFGRSADGVGVEGNSTSNDGVVGETSAAGRSGVYGNNTGSGYGVFGRSASGTGVRGEVSSDAGAPIGVSASVYSTSGIPYGMYAYAETPQFGTSYGIYAESAGSVNGWAGWFNGNVQVEYNLFKGGGGFKIDHPLDPENQYLYHSFVESPDMMNVYNGNVTLDSDGKAWVELPVWFETVNKDFRYQLTSIGGFAPIYVAQEIQGNRFQIAGGMPSLKVSWQVTGIRHDPYAEAHRIPVEKEKPSENRGTYLHPLEYGKPETLRENYQPRPNLAH